LQPSFDCFFESEYAAVQVLSRFCHGFATVLFIHKPGELRGFFLPITAYLVLSTSVFDLVVLPLLPKGRLTIHLQSGMRLAVCLAGLLMYN
jgi:hypothetical protein